VDNNNYIETIFENMTSGFAEHEMIYDQHGNPIDYRFLKVNRTFTELTGFSKDIIGKTIREIQPNTEQVWINKFSKVASSGKAISFEQFSSPLNRHYKVNAFCPKKGFFTTIFDDITNNVAYANKLKKMNQVQGLLTIIATNYINMPLSEVEQSINQALKEIGQSVNADRVYVFEYDLDRPACSCIFEWCNNGIIPKIDTIQNFSITSDNSEIFKTHQQNQISEYSDVSNITSSEIRDRLLNQGVKSILTLPIYVGKRLHGLLGFEAIKHPRAYREEEKGLFRLFTQILANIQSRKESDLELKQSEKDFRNIYESSTDGLFIIDAKTGKYIEANTPILTMFNAASTADFIGKLAGWPNPEYQPNGQLSKDYAKEKIAQVLANGTSFFEYTHLTIDGKQIVCDIHLQKCEYKGKDAITASLRDITKRKQTEEDVKLYNERLMALRRISEYEIKNVQGFFDYSLAQGIKLTKSAFGYYYRYNEDTKIFTLRSWANLGASKPEFLKHHATFAFSEEQFLSEVVAQKKSILINGYRAKSTDKPQASSPHIKIENYMGIPIFEDGSIVGVLSLANKKNDYTQSELTQITLMLDTIWKRLTLFNNQQALLLAKESAENIIASSPIPLAIVNVKTQEVYKLNKAYLDFMGIKSIAHYDPNKTYHDINDRKILLKILETEGCVKNFEVQANILSTGKPVWVMVTLNKIIYNDQDAIIMSMVDLSDIKETQNQLELARQEAEKASNAKSEFLANMSHEIRTPMNAVIGLNNLLQNTDLNVKQHDYVTKIGNSAAGLLNVINDILDFSKIESGKLSIEQIEFNIDEVFNQLSTLVSYKAYDKNLELLIEKDQNIPDNLVGDPLRLGQALLNLTVNAIKFTEYGEVLVKVDLVKDEQTIDLKFSIKDTGIGMTKSQQRNLFRPFEQADTSTTRKYGGTGLGLIITKNIINLMGGEVHVKSEKGHGSEFFFTLSFNRSNNTVKPVHVLSKDVKDISILAVDDNESARIIMDNYLAEFEYEPMIVSSGSKAIAAAQKKSFDIILMDWRMPHMDGIQTWQKMTEDKIVSKNCKSILITAFSNNDLALKAKQLGFDAVLTKPYSQSILVDTITNVYSTGSILDKGVLNDFIYPAGFSKVRGAKILIVEDNEVNRQVAKEMLEQEGFFVDLADDGNSAVNMVRKTEYDLIFMDLQMPVMDGYQASEKIRSTLNTKAPIVALSADAMSGIKERVFNANMDDYISKPIDRYKLFTVLVKWIMPASRVCCNDSMDKVLSDASTQTQSFQGHNMTDQQISRDDMILKKDKLREKLESLLEKLKKYSTFSSEHCNDLLDYNLDTSISSKLNEINRNILNFDFNHAIILCQDLLESIKTEKGSK
jgi:PAS domain S-box-containing protein